MSAEKFLQIYPCEITELQFTERETKTETERDRRKEKKKRVVG